MITVESFKQKLAKHYNIGYELVINDNRSTMLSILSRKRRFARLSVHRMFLEAPEDVISAIAHYVRGTKRDVNFHNRLLRAYIQDNLKRFNYADTLSQEDLITQGRYYDLKEIYDQINNEYFDNTIHVKIGWFAQWGRKKRTKVTYGQYLDHLKVVKIHRLLDDPFFPHYFISFIVYHEMLHHIVPGKTDARGCFRTHGAEFKRRERLYEDYRRAMGWEKMNKHRYLTGFR